MASDWVMPGKSGQSGDNDMHSKHLVLRSLWRLKFCASVRAGSHTFSKLCATHYLRLVARLLNCPMCKLEVTSQRYLAQVLPQAVHIKRIGPFLFHVALLQPTNLSTGDGQHMLQNKNNTGRGL